MHIAQFIFIAKKDYRFLNFTYHKSHIKMRVECFAIVTYLKISVHFHAARSFLLENNYSFLMYKLFNISIVMCKYVR